MNIRRFFRLLPILLGCSLLGTAPLRAEEAAPAKAPVLNVPSGAAPVAGHKFGSAAATRAWLDSMPAEKRAKSDAYFEGTYWLILWNFLLGSAIAIVLLGTRISARLRDFAARTTDSKSLQVA